MENVEFAVTQTDLWLREVAWARDGHLQVISHRENPTFVHLPHKVQTEERREPRMES